MWKPWKARINAVLLVAGFVAAFLIVFYVFKQAGESTGTFIWQDSVKKLGGAAFINTIGSFVIGAFASSAFLVGLATGLIAPANRDAIRNALESRYVLQTLFVLAGGIVAAVFQLGQVNSFAPIQALVLGTTWPSVLNQYLNGQSQNPNGLRAEADQLAKKVKDSPSGSSGSGPAPTAGEEFTLPT